jgi:AcrR family transcriptional regulator
MAGRERAPSSTRTAPNSLTPASNGIGRERVAEIQRVRMLAAMIEVAIERGASNVTVAHVVTRSGVSRRTFYELFNDREDCFLAAFEDCVSRLAHVVAPAFKRGTPWKHRVRSGLTELLAFLENEPAVGRLVVVEALGAGPRALERRRRVTDVLVDAVDEGRAEAKRGGEPPALTAEGVVGAVLSILHARLLKDQPRGFIDLLNPLMAMIVLPYLGRPAAARELNQPAVMKRRDGPRRVADPLRDLEMRLTYRTVRVLLAVAANRGSSNRTVADASGITDQGQISKLLARLQGLGLIENTGAGPTRGEPNAWTLTGKGREVHNALAHQTTRRPDARRRPAGAARPT